MRRLSPFASRRPDFSEQPVPFQEVVRGRSVRVTRCPTPCSNTLWGVFAGELAFGQRPVRSWWASAQARTVDPASAGGRRGTQRQLRCEAGTGRRRSVVVNGRAARSRARRQRRGIRRRRHVHGTESGPKQPEEDLTDTGRSSSTDLLQFFYMAPENACFLRVLTSVCKRSTELANACPIA